MIKTTTLGYALLLVIAFVVGLCGTLAASRAVLQMGIAAPRAVERPTSVPAGQHRFIITHSIPC